MAEEPELRFLSHLEKLEARLLTWGLVDGSFSKADLHREADRFLTEQQLWEEFDGEDALIQRLVERQFLHRYLEGTTQRFRTRMAETVRLMSRLKQLFPQHLATRRGWQTAPPLVGDFRFLLRPRAFPQRSVETTNVAAALQDVMPQTPLQKAVLSQLLRVDTESPVQLAKFQLRATQNILSQTGSRSSAATIVCAGTGSGKTLSFYLPAFLWLAESISSSAWTRCIAVYPRNELLKDQLSSAYRQARLIDDVLTRNNKRKLTVGALFGGTPYGEHAFLRDNSSRNLPTGWRQQGDAFICPFLQCPDANCTGEMAWWKDDIQAKRHKLKCLRCQTTTQHDELILTRQRLRDEPPDILFTTTEMLNQRMGDSRFAHVFGVNADRRQKPALVLLDEVHTYSGASGAQTGLLLRRWKHASGATPHFVGLSATLADASRFFATLTGVEDYRVEEVLPHPDDMTRQGMEYMLAVRGDPASRASLLSTSIQTAMLMRRTLDQNTQPDSIYGCREFIFTDDLDVTNRLFFNLRDAEGQNSWGQPDAQRNPSGSLANLRSTSLPDDAMRQRFGQSWEMCETLGHSLQTGNASLVVDRTSSQDAGVRANADVVVATASLEVGFNDPGVNVVVQHKAPRDSAQFLQRKGRAGRRTEMRPWTVVVLSDYGRDRLAWQSYDILFDPELQPRNLPISNRHILRMQATYAFFDWAAEQLRRVAGVADGSVWRDFSGPAAKLGSSYANAARDRQLAVARLIDGLLTRDDGYADLLKYLTSALNQPVEVIESLLWEPPRALMTAALPTLHRRLNTQWKRAEGGEDYQVSNHPLPEFVPSNLFSDLNLPEVTIVSPPQEQGDVQREEPLPILQAMREFAPGRVSQRFGVRNRFARHWIAPTDARLTGQQDVDVLAYVSRFDVLGEFQIRDATGAETSIRCLRPFEFQVQQPDRPVRDSSNGFLVWNTQIGPDSEGLKVDVPDPSPWSNLVREIAFFTHNHHSPLEIRRFATASEATINYEDGQEFETCITFVDQVQTEEQVRHPVALGFSVNVDGLAVRYTIPETLVESIAKDPSKTRSLRTARFADLLNSDASLDGIANSFQRRWLSQVYVSALVVAAIQNDLGIEDASAKSSDGSLDLSLGAVLAVIFQSIPVSTSGDDDDDDSGDLDDQQQRLQRDLTALLGDLTVLDALRRHAPSLWEEIDQGWRDWLAGKFKTTFGAAILDAIQQVCPDLDAGELVLDTDAGPRPPGSVPAPEDVEELWITEQTVGGGGIIENLMARYGEDPRRFFDLVESALKPADAEMADEQLRLFLKWTTDTAETTVSQAVNDLRGSETRGHDEYSQAFDNLKRVLSKKGLHVCHPVIAALSTRILRPGSNAQTDEMLHRLMQDWLQHEEALGIEIDARIFAYLNADDDALDQALGQFGGDAIETDRRQWRFGALYSALWPRGSTIRNQRLNTYNPFAQLPQPERALVRDCLEGEPQRVAVDRDDWFDTYSEHLLHDSVVVLEAAIEKVSELRDALMTVMAKPVDTGFLFLHPAIQGIERESGLVRATLALAEGRQ